jgi:hypothetical protein
MNHWLDMIKEHARPREDQYDDGWLLHRDDWPADFQLFLDTINGCDFEESPSLEVQIPIPWNDKPSISNSIRVMYGQKPETDQTLRGWLPTTDISFPKRVLAFAKFSDSSLAAISVRARDYGTVYYWDWYMQYPWRGDFYEKRVDPVYEQFKDLDQILELDEDHPRYLELNEAANEVLMVKLADSFEQFVSMIRVVEY